MIRLAKRSGGYLPTADEHELLRAALLDDGDAVRVSFLAWRARVDFDRLEYGSLRLLPLVYRNLQRHGVDDSSMPRLKGIYRQVWFRNQILLRHGLDALRMLGDAAIPALVLKGAALIATVYDELALRPMEDFDVLVPGEHFRRAIDRFHAEGWEIHPPGCDLESYLAFRHAVAFRRDAGGDVDLHRSAIRDCFDRAGEDEFWSASIPATFSGETMRVLGPADQFLQICGHASLRNADVAPIRWVADAWLVLARAGPSFDWQRVVRLARMRSLSFTILRCLQYLRDGLGANIPPSVMDALRRDSGVTSRIALRLRDSSGLSIYGWIAAVWIRLVFAESFAAVPRRLRLLRRYARFYFRVGSGVPLPLFLAARAMRRFRRARVTLRVTT